MNKRANPYKMLEFLSPVFIVLPPPPFPYRSCSLLSLGIISSFSSLRPYSRFSKKYQVSGT